MPVAVGRDPQATQPRRVPAIPSPSRRQAPTGAAKASEEVRLARAFVRGAKYRMVGHLKEMDKNRDAEQTAISETAYGSLGYAFPLWE